MDAEVLFAGLAVRDFGAARAFYERFFGRGPDVVAHEHEELWQVSPQGWLVVVRDPGRAGHGIASIAVGDLDATLGELRARGVTAGPVEVVSGAGRKAVASDPDGNTIALIEVHPAT
jgi:predicted enzyme related to lactoylglutathione lyase